jgi:hypothetical protein
VSHDECQTEPGQYCREIEAYLCRKNGGHLIRVVGASFALVVGWAQQGVPLKVVMRGIDRRLERHAAGQSARRPLRIEFCEADVLAVFQEWRRAVGIGLHSGTSGLEVAAAGLASSSGGGTEAAASVDSPRVPSLPRHLRRVIDRLAMVPDDGGRPRALDPWIAETVTELGSLEHDASRLRGAERAAALERLRVLDGEMLALAQRQADGVVVNECRRRARLELQPFAARLAPEALAASVDQAAARLLREALKLPVIALE